MDFNKICEDRFSCRSFSSKKVEEEKIEIIKKCVSNAPTAINRQPFKVFVANSDESVKKILEGAPTLYGGSTVFVVCSDLTLMWHNRYSGQENILQDIGIIATTIMYSAQNEGLNSIYICNFDPEKTKKVLNLEEKYRPECLMVVGYGDENAKPSDRHFQKKKITEIFENIE